MARQNKYQHPGDIRLPERAESFYGVDQGYRVGHYLQIIRWKPSDRQDRSHQYATKMLLLSGLLD